MNTTLLYLPVLGFSLESPSYTLSDMSSADYHYNIKDDIVINVIQETYKQKICTGDYSKLQNRIGKQSIEIIFSVDMHFFGTSLSPNYFTLLKSCGWKSEVNVNDSFIIETDDAYNIETDDAYNIFNAVSNIEIHTDNRENRTSSTIECAFLQEGLTPKQILYTIRGAMGSVEIYGIVGKPVELLFTFTGSMEQISTLSNENMRIPSDFDEPLPEALLSAEALLNEETIFIEEFSINCSNSRNMFTGINKSNGWDGCRITDTYIVGIITIIPTIDNVNNFMTNVINNDENVLQVENGNMSLQLYGVQFINIDDELNKFQMTVNNKITIGQVS